MISPGFMSSPVSIFEDLGQLMLIGMRQNSQIGLQSLI